LVWGTVTAGSAGNVIPQHGVASGTVRVLERGVWESAAELIPELIREIAAPYRAQVEIDYQRGVPPAVNNAQATETFRAAAAALLGPGAVQEAPQSMGAEDFAWFLDRVPGVLGRLGVRRPGTIDAPDLHRGDFDVDEAAIGCGTRVLLVTAMSALGDPVLTGT
jgi:amidohydrolase